MKEAGIAARGVDLSREAVALCHAKELEAEAADLFDHLAALAGARVEGIFCAQVVEDLAPHRLPFSIPPTPGRFRRRCWCST